MSTFNFEGQLSGIPSDLSPADRIAERNQIIARAFPNAVEKAGWRLLSKDSLPAPNAGSHVVVVGVVTWSKQDLSALGSLTERCLPDSTIVLILDLDQFPISDDLLRVLPGITAPFRTPVLVEYRSGKLHVALEGQQAISWCMGRDFEQPPSPRAAHE